MSEFSKLARRQAGQITLTGILLAQVAAGAAIYGLYFSYSSYQEHELVDSLGLRLRFQMRLPVHEAGPLSLWGGVFGSRKCDVQF